jgi:Cd2+/Zn2+-exporting ATPase
MHAHQKENDHEHDHLHDHDHSHDHDHKHEPNHSHGHKHGGHQHGHSHNHGGCQTLSEHDLNPLQAAILAAAKAVRWYQLSNILRESLPVAFGASALLLCSFLAPRLLPTALGANIGKGLVTAVFGLIGTPALLDAVLDLAGGRINIHVLMALAAFASVAMGSALEGALLLCLFTVSHAGEP